MAKAMALEKAYMTNQLPSEGGFIISANFLGTSIYTIYELTAYKNVKDIFQSPEGLTFKTDGNRCHILIEPPSYAKSYVELVHRDEGFAIPYRFDECHLVKGKRQENIYVSKTPIMLYSSFTIVNASEDNFSFLFFPTQDVYLAIKKFIADTLYNDCGVRREDCKSVSDVFLDTVKKFSIWHS